MGARSRHEIRHDSHAAPADRVDAHSRRVVSAPDSRRRNFRLGVFLLVAGLPERRGVGVLFFRRDVHHHRLRRRGSETTVANARANRGRDGDFDVCVVGGVVLRDGESNLFAAGEGEGMSVVKLTRP